MAILLSTPIEFNFNSPLLDVKSRNKTNLITVDPTNGNIRSNLNSSNVITFNFNASDTYINLSSVNSGIKAKIAFITRTGNNNAFNADITLSNSFFMHLFSNARFRINNCEIENINNIGVLTDVLNIVKGNYSESEGVMLDTNTGMASARKTNNIQVAANAQTDANFVSNNPDYNKGYMKRKLKYNYTVANDEVRELEVFIPLSSIFGFCDCYNHVIKFSNIQIDLTRKASTEYSWCCLGAADTSMRLGNTDNTGLMNIQLVIEVVLPSPEMLIQLEDQIRSPVAIHFLQRTCEMKTPNQEINYEISETQFSNPQFVIVVAKNSTADTPQRNSSLCLNADMSEIKVSVDGRDYPNISQFGNFNANCYSMFYNKFKEVCSSFNNDNPISPQDYKNLYSIFATDLTAQAEKLTSGISNLRISLKRRALPANDEDIRNVRSLHYYVIVLSETSYSLDMLRRILVKIK